MLAETFRGRPAIPKERATVGLLASPLAEAGLPLGLVATFRLSVAKAVALGMAATPILRPALPVQRERAGPWLLLPV